VQVLRCFYLLYTTRKVCVHFFLTFKGNEGEIVIHKGTAVISSISIYEHDKIDKEERTTNPEEHGSALVYHIPGNLTYLNALSHLERVKKVSVDYSLIIISMRYLFHMDMDGLDAITDIVKELESKEKYVFISGCSGQVVEMLRKAKWFQNKEAIGLVFPSDKDVLDFIDSTADDSKGEADGDIENQSTTKVTSTL